MPNQRKKAKLNLSMKQIFGKKDKKIRAIKFKFEKEIQDAARTMTRCPRANSSSPDRLHHHYKNHIIIIDDDVIMQHRRMVYL